MKVSDNPKLKYIKGNAKDYNVIANQLKNEYDAVVDFMIYYVKEEYEKFLPLYLMYTEHYVFLSTYRVYANEEHPIKETSPRILDVTKDEKLLNSGDYCIYKAQAEDYLKKSNFTNWTILRPAITYSKRRFQLVTLEYDLVVRRMMESKMLVLPKGAMHVQATMSWAGDVAKMIARLVLNKAAYQEIYSVCTSEHHTWEEIAQMYRKIGGLRYCTTDTENFLDIIAPNNIHARQQLILDGKSADMKAVKKKITRYFADSGWSVKFIYESAPWITPIDNPYLSACLKVYKEFTGRENPPVYVNAGATYGAHLPCAVEIGAQVWKNPTFNLPDGHGGAHQPDECISIDGMLEALEITVQMLLECEGTPL